MARAKELREKLEKSLHNLGVKDFHVMNHTSQLSIITVLFEWYDDGPKGQSLAFGMQEMERWIDMGTFNREVNFRYQNWMDDSVPFDGEGYIEDNGGLS